MHKIVETNGQQWGKKPKSKLTEFVMNHPTHMFWHGVP